MALKNKRVAARLRRKRAIRKRLSGTTQRPRLSVFRSSQHIYAQVIDDTQGVTLAAASSLSKEIVAQREGKKKGELAVMVGALIAERCLARDIKKVVFDRNGFIYHGRVKAVADAAREGGLEF
ncbi:50S ribosomal protein L18 [Myxococcota bacterium]|nr:50S ribosomal protein L18 [Myxococcota bacterium]MBU1430958.1 50S ribosomal protein L18 [Myxococcota bacterium]MBU1897247.1 50S ribosomal protein L18 [Myxococcota bacterium]